MQKSILASKTFWLNFLAAVVMVVQALSGEPWFDPSAQAAILAVANIGLRFLTNQPVVFGSVGKGLGIVVLAFSLTLVGCVGTTKRLDMAPVADVVNQLPGVVQSINTLAQTSPMDAHTVQQIGNYAAWAEFIAQTTKIVLPLVL